MSKPKSVTESFFDDLVAFKEEIQREHVLIGYHLYAAMEHPETGELLHFTATRTSDIDILISRLEMSKAHLIAKYREEKDQEYKAYKTDINPDIQELMDNFKIKKDDKPN